MKNPSFLLMALSLSLTAPAALAQASDPGVHALVTGVARAYRNMTAFSATITTSQGTARGRQTITTKLKLKKPRSLSAEISNGQVTMHIVADGKTIYTDSSQDRSKYLKQPDTGFQDVISALARSRGTGVGLLQILLTSPTAEKDMIPGHPTAIKLASDQTVGGDLCSVLVADIGTGAQSERFEFWFAKRDRFLRKLTIARAPEFAKPLVTETYSGVNAHPRVSAATFIYVPAAGAVATEPPKPGQMYDPRLTPGAMPLPITGKDMLGKAVSLDQFRGKVLLLDFWATWCGPCVAELPNVVAAYGKYHGKGFEVVGISLDQPDSRDKLIKFTQDNKMPWQQIYDGKYWEASNATAYGVSGIPFTVLVGRDGKIAAVDARGNALAPAIEAALKK